MKKLLLVSVLFFTAFIYAQYPDPEIVKEDESIEEIVPYAIVEEYPVFKDCEGLDRPKARKCFEGLFREHFVNNFNFEVTIYLPKGENKVYSQFLLDKKGNVGISQIKSKTHPKIIEEIKRVIKLLPKFKPAKQKGVNVGVKYVFPIAFTVD